MEPSRTSVDSKGKRPSLGRCKHFFWLGVVFDTVGVAVLFTGVFADLLFYDMLLYLGSIIIFLSLLWWISWYTGNIELLPEESSKRGSHMAAAPTAETLHQSVSHRFSWTIGSISNTFRIQRRHLRRSLKKRAILTMTVAGLEDESKGKDGRESVKDSVDSQEICKENLSPKPEDENNPEAIGSPGPDGGGTTLPVRPVFPPSTLDQPLPCAILASESPSVALLVSARPPPNTRNQPVSVASKTQPPVNLSLSLPEVPVAFQSHPVVPVSPPSPFEGHEASESQPQNLPWGFQTQPPTVRASGSQAMATHIPGVPFQTVDPRASQALQDFQALLPAQQTYHSSCSVQEICPRQSAGMLEVPREPVAQALEAPPLQSQKLSQKFPEAAASVPETQQSIPSESTPESEAVKKSHPLL